ncbi:MAG: hypothetical protein ACRDMJ_08215, partial [Solirubrobacteraceae bacterium]
PGVAGGLGVAAVARGAVLAISGLGAGLAIALLRGAALATAGGGAVVWTVRKGVSARRLRVRTGAEGLVGHLGVVRSWAGADGSVALDGALWRARRSLGPGDVSPRDDQGGAEDGGEASEPGLHPGDTVVVERLSGLTLSVRPAEEWELL